MFLIPKFKDSNQSKIFSHSSSYFNINGKEEFEESSEFKNYKNGKLNNIIEKKIHKINNQEKKLEVTGKNEKNKHYYVTISNKNNNKQFLVPLSILIFIKNNFNQISYQQIESILKIFNVNKKIIKTKKKIEKKVKHSKKKSNKNSFKKKNSKSKKNAKKKSKIKSSKKSK